MPSAGQLHYAYLALKKRAEADALAARKRALADFHFVALATRARRAAAALEPLVGAEVEAAVARADRDAASFLSGLDEAA